MKKLLIVVTIVTFPLFLKAQEMALGTPRDTIRASYEQGLLPILKSVQSDFCDTVKLFNGWQYILYYQEAKLNRMKFILPLNYADLMRVTLNRQAKTVKDDLWIDDKKGAKIQLIEDKEKNQCILDLTPIGQKN